MRWIAGLLLLVLIGFQSRLWIGAGSVAELASINQQVVKAEREAEAMKQRNALLAADVLDLKTGLGAIEERARNDLGMIAPDETFYQIID